MAGQASGWPGMLIEGFWNSFQSCCKTGGKWWLNELKWFI